MKLFRIIGLFTLASLALLARDAANPQLLQVQNVYVLPMQAGLDQHLASRLTSMGVVQVVTDPLKADAILTDRLGESFEQRLTELIPPPAPPKVDDDDEEKKDSDAAIEIGAAPPPVSTFGRGKGTFFLVDVKSRNVIWSVYQKPRGTSVDELNRTAERVVKKLRDARAVK